MQNVLKCSLALNLPLIANQLIKFVLTSGDSTNSNGFYSLYKWCSIKDAFIEANTTRKPIFLLIHKSWCPACKKLENKFTKSLRLIDLSRNFIMVNVENTVDVVNNNKKFYPDGKYIPRILFFDPSGELIKEAYNRSPQIDPKNRYYYSTPGQIIDTMIFVLSLDFDKGLTNPKEYKDNPNIIQPINEKPSFHKPIVSD